jgi:hypothetical protein
VVELSPALRGKIGLTKEYILKVYMRKPLSGRNGCYTIKEKSEEFLYSRLSSGK